MTSSTIRCLPLEVIEMCLHFYAWHEREPGWNSPLERIASLRLLSRHFRDVYAKEFFESVTLQLRPNHDRPAAFLDLVRKNQSILKCIRNVTIEFREWEGSDGIRIHEVERLSNAVRIFSQTSLTTLTVCGLDEDFPSSSIYNALHTLRSNRSLQKLNISGTAVPPFLVCGHFASTRLKSIEFPFFASPDSSTHANFLQSPTALTIGPDSILANTFQPFAELRVLSVPNGVDVPKYFPLQDFGSTYYTSNGRIPFTLPALQRLQVGNSEQFEDNGSLRADDYKVLGTLLSRAPNLEALRIVDKFWMQDDLNVLAPLIEQIPTLKKLDRLELVDLANGHDEGLVKICSILNAFPLLPALTTLTIDVQWNMSIDATRASLYFSEAWLKLQRILLGPGLASLCKFILNLKIMIANWSMEPEETFGAEEAEALKDALGKCQGQVRRDLSGRRKARK